jgi:hypothetical protein
VDEINVAGDRYQWRILVNMVMNFRIPQKVSILLTIIGF